MRWPRRRSVPAPVGAVALAPDERLLSWALTTSGEAVVATTVGLHLPGETVLPWYDVERASFVPPALTVLRVAEVEGSGASHRVELDLAGQTDLPVVVRACVSASVAWSSHQRLQPAGGVRVVGRRRPGVDALDWQLVFDRDTDPQDARVRAQAEQCLDTARRTIG